MTTTLTASALSRTLRFWGWNTREAIQVSGGPGRVTVSVDTGLHLIDEVDVWARRKKGDL